MRRVLDSIDRFVKHVVAEPPSIELDQRVLIDARPAAITAHSPVVAVVIDPSSLACVTSLYDPLNVVAVRFGEAMQEIALQLIEALLT
jgi:hypothetical protein